MWKEKSERNNVFIIVRWQDVCFSKDLRYKRIRQHLKNTGFKISLQKIKPGNKQIKDYEKLN